MKIKLTNLYVDDQEKALRFYTEILGFVKKADYSQGPFRWLTVASPGGPGRHGTAAGAQQQPGGQSLPAGDVPAKPARRHVLHRRPAGRLRAYESARRRVHHAAKRRDRIQDRDAERHLRQSYSGHAVGGLVGKSQGEDR